MADPVALPSRKLVDQTAEAMRAIILDEAPDALIGSLPDLARRLGVGPTTVQQAARVLEHEGLLAVRRGPNGGYFGRRPDAAALERSVDIYLRVRGSGDYEPLEMMTLLDCELMPAAARSTKWAQFEPLRALRDRIDLCLTTEARLVFEDELHAILFRLVDTPLIELLASVAMRFYRSRPLPPIFEGEGGLAAWRRWRHQVIDAILARDPDLARFEAERHRRGLLERLARLKAERP